MAQMLMQQLLVVMHIQMQTRESDGDANDHARVHNGGDKKKKCSRGDDRMLRLLGQRRCWDKVMAKKQCVKQNRHCQGVMLR